MKEKINVIKIGLTTKLWKKKFNKKIIVMKKTVKILNDDKFGDEKSCKVFLVYDFFQNFFYDFFFANTKLLIKNVIFLMNNRWGKLKW